MADMSSGSAPGEQADLGSAATLGKRADVGSGPAPRTRADLVAAVYRHQVEACAAAGPELLASADSPYTALTRWIDLFVDFLVTKHGLAEALQSDDAAFQTLHAYFLDRLVPVCADLLAAATRAGQVRTDIEALELLRGVGNLCIGAGKDSQYDARRMVTLLLTGLQHRPSTP